MPGAIAADCVDMHARADHVVGQDRLHILISGGGGDDIRALNRLLWSFAERDIEPKAREVSGTFFGRGHVDVIEPDAVDAIHGLLRKALEFGLCAIADHRHRARALGRKVLGRHGGHGRGAQRGQHGHFRQHERVAGIDVGEKAERGHGLQPLGHILRVAIHIFEAVHFAIRGRHQLNHTDVGMRADTRGFVEEFPAGKVGFDFCGDVGQKFRKPDMMHKFHHMIDGYEWHHGQL